MVDVSCAMQQQLNQSSETSSSHRHATTESLVEGDCRVEFNSNYVSEGRKGWLRKKKHIYKS